VNYYNDNEPYVAQWLRNLIDAKLVPPGDVDDRSIKDVQAKDLEGYIQCHFFAGIAGWAYALQLANFPTDRRVWTGSCPCQPFSSAGKQRGTDDPRHLWPEWFRLIRECKPELVFGEQVDAAIRHGWLDLVFDDMENEGYTCGAAIVPACSVSAPHIRQRVWFVGVANGLQREQLAWCRTRPGQTQGWQSYGESARPSEMASWPTQNTPTGGPNTKSTARHTGGMDLDGVATLAAWATPRSNDAEKRGIPSSNPRNGNPGLVQLAAWPTPNAMEGGQTSRGGDRRDELLMGGLVDTGTISNGCLAGTEKRGQLNPAFSLWLIGFPDEWLSCAP
jgi:site-specific DNA-cytosine methylase